MHLGQKEGNIRKDNPLDQLVNIFEFTLLIHFITWIDHVTQLQFDGQQAAHSIDLFLDGSKRR